jgi:hypothetical protein
MANILTPTPTPQYQQPLTRVRLAVVVAVAALAMGALVAPSQGRAVHTPPRELTTVIANLNKAYGGSHTGRLNDMSSVRAFVRRALEMTIYPPDVVLLSEVRARPAKAAARAFSNKTGDTYKVAAMPGKVATKDYPGKQIHKDTAIILNATSMKQMSRGAFMTHKYTRAEAAKGQKLKFKKTAYTSAVQRSGGGLYAFASVHLAPSDTLRSKAISNSLRRKWARQIKTKLHNKFPNAVMRNIGGDFNMSRCYSGSFASCQEAKFWSYLTSHGYVDSLYSMPKAQPGNVNCDKRETGVDYIFSTGNPLKGRTDSRGGYSDHKLRWALNEAAPYQKC